MNVKNLIAKICEIVNANENVVDYTIDEIDGIVLNPVFVLNEEDCIKELKKLCAEIFLLDGIKNFEINYMFCEIVFEI